MKRIFAFIAAALVMLSAAAQKVEANRPVKSGGYKYWLCTPKSAQAEDAELVPLVIFLHGSSLCGNDLNKVLRYGTVAAWKKGLDIDAYVIAPQNPGGAWKPEKVMDIVDYLVDSIGGIDTSRIYVLGMSLGGYGTIDVAATYPNRIAAAMAMCGGASVKDVSGLVEMPLWIIHGTADAAVSIRESDKVVERMRTADPDTPRLLYTRVPGMGHSEPARLFFMPEVYEWLFSHSLEDYDRYVTEGFSLDKETMGGAYRSVGKRSISVYSMPEPSKRIIEYKTVSDR